MEISPVRDPASYEQAVADVRRLWGATPGTPDGDRLEVLMILIEAYENRHHAIEAPEPIAALRIRMEEMGLDRTQLGEMLGISSGRVSEILNRRRRLTIDMVRRLAAGLRLSEACLLQPYALSVTPKAPRQHIAA
jgi:HTH-type transcriptional regulator/antitoxin HigA